MTPLQPGNPNLLLFYAIVAVVGLVVMIAKFRLNAFVAIIISSIFIGLMSGMKLPDIARAFQEGVGSILGSIAVVVGLGAIMGKLLAESGGAEVVADRLIKLGGEKNIHWTMMFLAYIVGVSVFFNVGIVILFPIFFTVAKRTNLSLVYVGVPILAGLSVMHGLVPPHPGPMAAIGSLGADTGKVIMYALIIGLPTAMISGPMIGRLLSKNIILEPGAMAKNLTQKAPPKSMPGFWTTVITILFPILLMMLDTVGNILVKEKIWAEENMLRQATAFIGAPMVAMTIGVLVCFFTFGYFRGFNKEQVLKFGEEAVAPVALVLLVVGAGGGFNKVLHYSGVGGAIAVIAAKASLSPILLGWMIACLIRIAAGSATVAITTAAGIIAPIVQTMPGVNLELLVVAMGAGSLILSHVNDSGFWFVKEYFNMSISQTLRTWTIVETMSSVTGLIFTLIANAIWQSLK
jgi:GntP family gluconate:H+ symporter